MIRNLRALALAVGAVLALGAALASSASAVPTFHSENEKTIITAGKHVPATFGTKTSSLSVTCEVEEFYGTQKEKTAASVTVHPVYTGCAAPPLGNATVDTHGCDYVLYAETTSRTNTSGGTETDAPVEVECTAGSSIKITAPSCTITIGAQGKLHGVSYTNEETGSKRAITVKATVDGIHYTTSGFGCGLAGLPGTGTDGTLTGAATAKGYVDTKFVTNATTHTLTEITEGAQVGIWKE